jgi:hypothetical protein
MVDSVLIIKRQLDRVEVVGEFTDGYHAWLFARQARERTSEE